MPRIRFAPLARNAPLDVARWAQAPTSGARHRAMRHDTYRGFLPSGHEPARDFAIYRNAMLAYDIFPATRMEKKINSADGRIQLDAVIVQRAFVGPFALEMAVRVTEIIDEPHRFGFVYETLEGHAERGRERFLMREDPGGFTMVIEAWSTPGWLVARSVAPFSRFVQKRATREALEHMETTLERAKLAAASSPASPKASGGLRPTEPTARSERSERSP